MTHRAVVGERHIKPTRIAVNCAMLHGMEPPPVLILGLDKTGSIVAGGMMRFAEWYGHYITGRKVG